MRRRCREWRPKTPSNLPMASWSKSTPDHTYLWEIVAWANSIYLLTDGSLSAIIAIILFGWTPPRRCSAAVLTLATPPGVEGFRGGEASAADNFLQKQREQRDLLRRGAAVIARVGAYLLELYGKETIAWI